MFWTLNLGPSDNYHTRYCHVAYTVLFLWTMEPAHNYYVRLQCHLSSTFWTGRLSTYASEMCFEWTKIAIKYKLRNIGMCPIGIDITN